jgi:hypothetical protein
VTQQSPEPLRIFVTRAGLSDSANDVGIFVDALRAGRGRRGTIGSLLAGDCLDLEAGRVAPAAALAELRGFARTTEQPQIKGDLQPARALRRALADGRLNASDIGYACAFELRVTIQARAMHALERGLGRFAATIELETAQDPFTRAVAAVGRSDHPVTGSVALLIQPGVGSIALVFGRPR